MPLPQQEPQQQISEQEYLDGELLSEVKHEFIDGAVYAMAGASADHGRIAGNLFAAFLRHLQERKSPCEPFLADMKVKTGNKFFYPDVLISCEREENDSYRNAPVNEKRMTLTAMPLCSLSRWSRNQPVKKTTP
ncbi:Uma2 family endonuclease [Candidatus Electrothrix sp.]|uniref:Uma2 family endonuclease n=1 Tax=Candidatus Electrothrix sp. TaxID=2170559 RepID=UPI0040579376